jgi:hypothetical protein
MRNLTLLICALLCVTDPAVARDPVTGLIHSFFYYQAPLPPVGGDCAAIAAEVGPASTWFGEFSGKRELVNERFTFYSTRGCFESEFACRVWQQQVLTYATGAITYTSCRPGYRG